MNLRIPGISAAARVTNFIGVVKWIVIAATNTVGVVTAVTIFFGWYATGEDAGTAAGYLIAVGVLAGTAACSLFFWVVFGWFEHTLSMLTMIAHHTAETNWVHSQGARP